MPVNPHFSSPATETELELKRSPGDRRLYALHGVGTLRLDGLFSRKATAEADGGCWHFTRHGLWRSAMRATDATGAITGEFVPRSLRRGGTLRWAGRALTLRPASSWRERYALAEGERELATLDGKGWGKRPVRITVDEPGALEPELVLFAAFVVRGLAEDAGSASASASGAAAASG